MRNIKRNKKASLQDMIFIGIVLTFFAVVTLISFKIAGEFDTQIQANSAIPTDAKTASTELVGTYNGSMDTLFLLLTIGLIVVTLVFAALVRVHPIFVPLFIIGWIILVFMSGILSNIYTEMGANTELKPQADQLTFMTSIMGALPFIIAIVGILIMIVLHKLGNIAQ